MVGKALLSAAAAASAFLLSSTHGFVIQLRSEEEFADAVESYPSLAVHFHDPASEASRRFAAEFRAAGREMLQQQQQSFGVQFASVDRTAEDFQNIVAALGRDAAGSGGGGDGADVQVYVDAQPVDPRLHQPVAKASNAAELVLGVRTTAGKAMSRNKAKSSNSGKAPSGTTNDGGQQPKPKPKPKPAKAQQKDKKPEKKPKDKKKGKPQKQKQQQEQQPQQKQMHSDEDLLVEPASSKVWRSMRCCWASSWGRSPSAALLRAFFVSVAAIAWCAAVRLRVFAVAVA